MLPYFAAVDYGARYRYALCMAQKLYRFAIIVALSMACACSSNHFHHATLAVSTGALALDWQQTRERAAGNWRATHESNPLMGRKPTPFVVDAYFATTLVGNAVLWYVLPQRWKSVIPGVIIGVESPVITSNALGWN